jgi:membrane fusion protein, multidrug efflux system
MVKPFMAGLVVLMMVVIGCAKQAEKPAAVAALPKVQVRAVVPQDVTLAPVFAGRSVSKATVDLKSFVSGYLLERSYVEGGPVKKGDVLFRIDPREFQADLDTASAKQDQAAARLAQAELDLKRIEPLAEAGAVARQELDNARTALLSAQADVNASRAAVANAQMALSYATITAPFDGRVGKASVDAGALVSPQSGVLATIDQVDPMAIEFTVSEKSLLSFRSGIESGKLQAPAKDHFQIKVALLDGSFLKETGRVDFSDIRIKTETGTALLRAIVPNADGQVLPGQFVRVSLEGLVRKDAILVPQGAVSQSPDGANVLCVNPDGTVRQVPVLLGDWFNDSWFVESGLKAGDVLIVDGVQKTRPGEKVQAVALP